MAPDNVTPHRYTEEFTVSNFMTDLAAQVVDEMLSLRLMLRRVGGGPYFVIAGSEETILGYLMARLG